MSALDSNLGASAARCPSSAEGEAPAKFDIACSVNSQLLDARLRRLFRLIEADPLGNSQNWALELNLSNSHLQRLFKKATGVALGQALNERRLQKAAQLLATTNLRIKEIACAVGYEHTSSFTRAFEKRFEQAPRSFRSNNTA